MAVQTNPCSRGARHWFSYYGWVGSSAPTCRHCGEPNQNYRPDDDPKPNGSIFKPGDWAAHVSGTLDSREVVEVKGPLIRLRIGSLVTPWLRGIDYWKVGA